MGRARPNPSRRRRRHGAAHARTRPAPEEIGRDNNHHASPRAAHSQLRVQSSQRAATPAKIRVRQGYHPGSRPAAGQKNGRGQGVSGSAPGSEIEVGGPESQAEQSKAE